MVATGDLTVNGVTNTVQTPLQAQVVDGMILITGSSEIQWPRFDRVADGRVGGMRCPGGEAHHNPASCRIGAADHSHDCGWGRESPDRG
jgi:hypothetical protein